MANPKKIAFELIDEMIFIHNLCVVSDDCNFRVLAKGIFGENPNDGFFKPKGGIEEYLSEQDLIQVKTIVYNFAERMDLAIDLASRKRSPIRRLLRLFGK